MRAKDTSQIIARSSTPIVGSVTSQNTVLLVAKDDPNFLNPKQLPLRYRGQGD